MKFRGDNYTRITCNTNGAGGVERVFDGSVYQVQIIDTGVDGVIGGGDDSVVFDDPAFFAKVAGTTGLPEEQRYAETPRVFDISINGATSSRSMGGSVVPLSGYIDTSEPVAVSWAALAGTDTYQLRLKEAGIDMLEYRYSTTGTSTSIDISRLGQELNLRLVAINNVSPPTGATAQAFSRKLNIAHGINGLFNVELGGATDINLETFQLNLGGNASGMHYCEVMNNPAYSCKLAGSGIDFNADVVTLSITDNIGAIVGSGINFTLQLHFKTTGVITSDTAVVTSPDVAGIPDTPALSNASARMVNSELYLRSFTYTNGDILTRAILVNPVEETIYQKAVLKVNNDTEFVVNGSLTGIFSGALWNDTDAGAGNDFGNRIKSYTQYPTDDGLAQSSGRYVSVRSDTTLGLGIGLLAVDRYKLVLTNPSDPDDKLIFRKNYNAPDPAGYDAPLLDQITVIRPGVPDVVPCSSATPVCDITSPVEVGDSSDNFGLSWTIPTPPAGARWQIVAKDLSSGATVRSLRILPAETGTGITAVDNGDSTTTFTWTNPGISVKPGMKLEIQLRVTNSNGDAVGLSDDQHKVYVEVGV